MVHSIRALVEGREFFVAPGVYDGLTAHLVRSAGFRGAYMSGAAVAASLGLPDIGLATQTELAGRAATITKSLGSVPLIADADTGFGDIAQVVRTVEEYVRSGVGTIQLEDQVFPKRCGHLEGKRLISPEDFAAVIRAAVSAASSSGASIIARTDAIAVEGFDEAIRRANLYAQAGADVVFVEAPQTMDQVTQVPQLVSAPVMFNIVPHGKTPEVSLAQLQELGYSFAISPLASMSPAMEAMVQSLAALADEGVTYGGPIGPYDIFEAVGIREWEALGA